MLEILFGLRTYGEMGAEGYPYPLPYSIQLGDRVIHCQSRFCAFMVMFLGSFHRPKLINQAASM